MSKVFRLFTLMTALFFFSFTSGLAQDDKDPEKVKVTLSDYQSAEEFNEDKQACAASADEQVDATGHKTIKNTGAGVAGGAVIGKILGKPGLGAIAGGAAGAYRGKKKSGKDKTEFNNVYASCLREKGYQVEVEE